MGQWSSESKTHVVTMDEGDFFHNEKSVCLQNDTKVRVELHKNDGSILY